MQLAPIITFRGLEGSPALDTEIRKRIDKLNTYYPAIMGCRVLVELAERHHEAGNRFHVRIDVTVPGSEIVVSHDPSLRGSAQDRHQRRVPRDEETHPERKHAFVAVREAFDTARRRLQDYARVQRGDVKAPAEMPSGRIVRLFQDEGYGFIEAADGHEVYFQRSSLIEGSFDTLAVDDRVSFVEEQGDKGPQASTVRATGPRRRRAPQRTPVHG